jgi:hypothetical protein
MTYIIEETIVNSLNSLLMGRVNELLGEAKLPIPPVEFGGSGGGSAVVPVLNLSTCERLEKKQIVRVDAYSLTITFTLPDLPDGERCCYAYASAVEKAMGEDPALGVCGAGCTDWAEI